MLTAVPGWVLHLSPPIYSKSQGTMKGQWNIQWETSYEILASMATCLPLEDEFDHQEADLLGLAIYHCFWGE